MMKNMPNRCQVKRAVHWANQAAVYLYEQPTKTPDEIKKLWYGKKDFQMFRRERKNEKLSNMFMSASSRLFSENVTNNNNDVVAAGGNESNRNESNIGTTNQKSCKGVDALFAERFNSNRQRRRRRMTGTNGQV